MVFFSKVGGLVRQTVSRQIESHLSSSSPSVFQSLRWMSSSKLFIGGLSYSTDESSLREAFGRYGNVYEAKVVIDRDTGRSKGFGFISFDSSEEASSAIQALDGQELQGRVVRVAYATERPRTPRYDGGSYAGGGGVYGGGNYGGESGGYGGSGGGSYGGSGGGSYGGSIGGYGGGGEAVADGNRHEGSDGSHVAAADFSGGGDGEGVVADGRGIEGSHVAADTSFASSGYVGEGSKVAGGGF